MPRVLVESPCMGINIMTLKGCSSVVSERVPHDFCDQIFTNGTNLLMIVKDWVLERDWKWGEG